MADFSREYLSSSSLTAFPFSDYSVPERVYRLFCDAVVSVPLGYEADAAVSDVHVLPDGILLFSLTVAGKREDFSVSASEHEESYFVVTHADTRSSIVVDIDHLRDSAEFDDDGSYPISVSCANFSPGGVVSFSLWNSEDGVSDPVCTAANIQGDVMFLQGTNTTVVASDSGIEIEASPGAGDGKVKCECPEPQEGSEGSNLKPDIFGGIVIAGDGCVDVSTPFDENGKTIGTLILEGRCSAPCPTSKYIDELNNAGEQNDRVTDAYMDLMSIAAEYNRLVTEFNKGLKGGSKREFVMSLTGTRPIPRSNDRNWKNSGVVGYHNKYFLRFVLENRSRVDAKVVITLEAVTQYTYLSGFTISPPAEVDQRITVRRSPYWSGDPGIVVARTSEFILPSGSSVSGSAIYYKKVLHKYMEPGSAQFVASASINTTPGDPEIPPAALSATSYATVT